MADRRFPRWTLALTSVAFFMVALDGLVVITALPAIHRDLGASLSTLEWTGRSSMLPLPLFASRGFAAASATAFLQTAALFAAAFLAAQYFQFVLGFSPLGTGLRFLPWTATPLLVAPAAGVLLDRIAPRPLMVAGLLRQGVGLACFALLATTGVGYEQLVLPLLVAGVGISMAVGTTPTAILSAIAAPDMGKASGANSTLQRFGSAFGIAVASAVFVANGHLGIAASFTAGFRPALAAAAGLSVLGALSALAVGSRRRLPAAAQSVAVAPRDNSVLPEIQGVAK